jgi:protein-tyrosine phosphatase
LTQVAGDPRSAADDGRAQGLVTAAGRRIELAGLYNLRDVGGYPAASGPIPWRTLLRSDALHRLEPEGVAALQELGLRTVVDLRTLVEAEIAPGPLDALSARYAHVSILGGDMQSLPLELAAVYAFMIEQCGRAIADAIRPLCGAAAFPALVHCSAGKDRTGIVIAMVLAVLGVPDDIIAADYALSGSFLDQDHTAAIGQLQAGTGLGEQLTGELLTSPPQLILSVLAAVRAEHGSVPGFLLAHGLDADDLAALRAALAG